MAVPIVRWLPLICLFIVGFTNLASAERPNFAPMSLVIATEKGEVAFKGELASTPEQITYGLMFRTEIADDYAMLFDFGREKQASFWMKDTLLSLDMIFVRSDGRIANIITEVPPLTHDLRHSKGKVRWVIEVLAGTATKHGIKAGDKVKF